MATNGRVPYGYGGPVPRDEPQAPAVADPSPCQRRPGGKSATGPCIVIFVCVAALVGFMYVLHLPVGGGCSKARLEAKQAGDLRAELESMVKNPRPALRDIKELRGKALYEAAVKRRLMDSSMLSKLVSLNSASDSKAGREWIDRRDGKMPEESCSYTAPRGGELATLIDPGHPRVVLFTFNSRNWNNYPDEGVLVMWSDAEAGTYMTFDEAHEQFGITAEEWADPAGKLFGKKAPFQHTYE